MNIILIDLSLVCYVAFLMVIWFESDLVSTIANITRTRKLFKIAEYEKYKLEEDLMCNYPSFLYEKHGCFFTKLLSCPICTCFWTTLITSFLLVNFLNYNVILTLFILPINYVSSLFIYLIIRKLL